MCVRSIVKAELIFFTYITLIWKLQPLIKNVLLCVSLLISQESFLECLEKVWGKFDFRFLCHAYCVKTQIFGDTLIPVFVNENCCLRKCFTKLYFFYWLLVVSLAILIACTCRLFSSFMNIACRSTQKCRAYQTLYKITHRYNWNH